MTRSNRSRTDSLPGFWHWFFRGTGGSPGYRRLFDRWTALQLAGGVALAMWVPIPLDDAARTLLLPLAGIFIGLSFAWGSNTQALLRTREVRKDLAGEKAGGFYDYVYMFQLGIAVILATLGLWGLAGLRIFDDVLPTAGCQVWYLVVEIVLYYSAVLALAVCFAVVRAATLMLLSWREIREAREEAKEADETDEQ